MTARPKALIAWSSGKDWAWALHEARRAGEFDIVGALTTVTDTFARVSMHGVREELLQAQLDAAGLPAIVVRIPYPCPNDVYEREMAEADRGRQSARHHAHHLRRSLSSKTSAPIASRISPAPASRRCFRCGCKPTDALARDMIDGGLEAHLAVVDLKKLPASFAGRRFDAACSTHCRPASTRAARTANSIPSCRPGRC